jgi:hypothetical protein
MFANHFSLILMGFLTTHIHNNSQNNFKLLESFDIYCVKELIFVNIRNSLIFIKIAMDPNVSIKPCVHCSSTKYFIIVSFRYCYPEFVMIILSLVLNWKNH